jgi:hypothetical protein
MDAQRTAELAGFDLSLIDESLRISPEQRVLQHQQALDLALQLEMAGKAIRERTESSPATTDRR